MTTATLTRETQKESFELIKTKVGTRHKQVLLALEKSCSIVGLTGVTAGELADRMWMDNITPSPDRNYAHPRLNELATMGLVEITGKRKCAITGRTCATYRVANSKF